MNTNTEAITTVIEKLIKLGTNYTSERYSKFILEKIIRDLIPQYTFAEKIKTYPDIYIAPGIDSEDEKKVGDFLNLIVAKIGVNLINYNLKNSLSPTEELELQRWGI